MENTDSLRENNRFSYQHKEAIIVTWDASDVHLILYGVGRFGTPYLGTARNIHIDDGFAGLAEMLASAAQEPFDPARKTEREWISPVILNEDAQHRGINDIEMLVPFICLDMDAPGWSLARLRATLDGLKCIIHTTASSSVTHPRWRVIVALDRTYSVAEHGRVWRWFNLLLDGEMDQSTKDASRISYFPARYTGAWNQFHVFDGQQMDIDLILDEMPEDVSPHIVPMATLNIAPDQAEIIEDWMWQKESAAPVGGRMWRILCRATSRFKRHGWTMDAQQLADAFLAVNCFIAPNDTRKGILHDARNAITWATTSVETEPLPNTLKWKMK